jgi:AmmeMemoRadiSam system protein A
MDCDMESDDSESQDKGLRAALSPEDERELLCLARRVVEEVAAGAMPEFTADGWSVGLNRRAACFVTLRAHGQLRGCIGQLKAVEPLWRAVVENAESAARRDHRFAPVTLEELDELEIELSVLSEPVPLVYTTPLQLLGQLRPGMDGVVLRIGGSVSTFLPQVWDDLSDKEDFMAHLSRKAGHEDEAWRGEGVEVSVYQVHHFSER